MAKTMRSPSGILSYFVRHPHCGQPVVGCHACRRTGGLSQNAGPVFPRRRCRHGHRERCLGWAGAEDVDAAIVQILEPALLSVDGVESSSAVSREGSGSISLDFEPGWDVDRGAADIEKAVEAIRTLPVDAEDPQVRRGVWRDRVTDVVITGPVAVETTGPLCRRTDHTALCCGCHAYNYSRCCSPINPDRSTVSFVDPT